MSEQKPKYIFTERFTLNNKKVVDLSYGVTGGIYDKPYSLEEAVVEYTAGVFKSLGIKAEDIKTIDQYNSIGLAIAQSEVLAKTSFGLVMNHYFESSLTRSLLGEVQCATA